ncbi:XrtA/PEP-CTERM system exopolysaccharide export protein [Thiomonas sp. FB-Cd]|uniref:XrtA/PEP-CTERM system exopolysaccharide export protein n=1 Tax=Thiomonas sp. FB-Cd TaxID=1158292 RepID=UPI0004DFAD07|nr:XrtA/PEP-CTERM system exopolysaccharide export protein [Thiomonas sp. FB-Cd]
MCTTSLPRHAGRLPRLFAAFMAFLLSACASNNFPPAPSQVATSDYHYIIGSGDTLHITVWQNPDLSSTVQVRPDGRISSPLVSGMQAAGLTPDQLATEISKHIAKYVRDPVVTVVVSNFHGALSQQVSIVGAAAKPQSIPYRDRMTLLDAMIVAGGLSPYANGNAAVLIRNGKSYSVRLDGLLRRGNMADNVPLLPGDTIVIPQGWF